MVAVQIAKLKTRNVFILILSKRHYLNLLSMPGIIPTSEGNMLFPAQLGMRNSPKITTSRSLTNRTNPKDAVDHPVLSGHNGSALLPILYQQ